MLGQLAHLLSERFDVTGFIGRPPFAIRQLARQFLVRYARRRSCLIGCPPRRCEGHHADYVPPEPVRAADREEVVPTGLMRDHTAERVGTPPETRRIHGLRTCRHLTL